MVKFIKVDEFFINPEKVCSITYEPTCRTENDEGWTVVNFDSVSCAIGPADGFEEIRNAIYLDAKKFTVDQVRELLEDNQFRGYSPAPKLKENPNV